MTTKRELIAKLVDKRKAKDMLSFNLSTTTNVVAFKGLVEDIKDIQDEINKLEKAIENYPKTLERSLNEEKF